MPLLTRAAIFAKYETLKILSATREHAMAKKATKAKEIDPVNVIPEEGAKLRKLIIKNLGCIGKTPVEIDLDDIVVLVGKNNTGKSTILRAYNLLFSSPSPKLDLEDFPENRIDPNNLPQIELHTKVTSKPPGNTWIGEVDGENVVRERWTWSEPKTAATRQGFDVLINDWSENVPWGAPNVANSRRPKPHRIEAFATPEDSIAAVVKILMASLQGSVKALPLTQRDEEGNEVKTSYGELLDGLANVQKSVVEEATEQIEQVQTSLTDLIQNVFRGYKVTFDAKPEEDLSTCLTFFKPGAVLRMGPETGHLSSAELQGSGARRTLMWAALKYAREHDLPDQQHLLLMDEPELCLHPNAIREACSVLYDLPEKGNWQVMVTTHSPAFIDLSRDNTTVVRVERDENGETIRGATVFRPENVKLSEDEKVELKLLNICDPNLCEFFFGGRTVIVEGDTEYTAFKYIIEKYPGDARLKDVHIVRARGKATICLVAKLLNQFRARYAVLHDSDSPECVAHKKNGEPYKRKNSAWTNNEKIRDELRDALGNDRARLIAMIPNFEAAFFNEEVSTEKPVNAWSKLRESDELCEKIRQLLYCLLEFSEHVPGECAEWSELNDLRARYDAYTAV